MSAATIIADRFKFREVEVLNQYACVLTRMLGAAIAPSNYGFFEDSGALNIPSSNVGTVIQFPKVLKDYLYVDIYIVGGIAGVSALSPEGSFGFTGGVKAVTSGRYTVRIPYVGSISALKFELKDYRVSSIKVGYTTDYVLEAIDDVNWVISPSVDWTSSTGQVSANVAPGATVRGTTVVGFPTANTFGKLWIETYKPLYGLPTIVPGVTFYDGDSCFSYFTFTPFVMVFNPFPTTNNAWIEFTNTLGENVILKIYMRVLSFRGLSTVYGDV